MTRSHAKNGGTAMPKSSDSAAKRQLAVALRYVPDGDAAPKVTASGRGKLAEQILKAAFDHGVKVREDADLAELLSALDVGEDIPIEAFAAVAEILTYVYRATGEYPEEILANAEPATIDEKQE